MSIVPEFNNEHEAINFHVSLTLSDGNDGSTFQGCSHAPTKEQAIVEVLKEYLSTDRTQSLPFVGISVYQCVFTA